jgi:signal transduction histidine kinase
MLAPVVQPSTLRSVFVRPTPRHLLVASPFVAVAIVLVAMAIFFMDVLSAARAFVGGESLWTKGQKQAVQHLERYAQTGAESAWRAYEQAIAVPLGDRVAREELEKPSPDFAVARRGFIDGANHEDDIGGMIRLFRWFRRVSFIDHAIRTWAEGDELIAKLIATADELRRAVQAGAGADTVAPLLQRIEDLDRRLTPLELRFSATLGEGSRRTLHLLTAVMIGMALLLTMLGALVARRVAQRAARIEERLRVSEEGLREANEQLEQRVAVRTRELREANERLMELDRMKSQFLATMSHELRTPLNSILGFTSLMREGMAGPLTQEQQRQLGFVHASGEHLLALINDLLDLSRIESGRMDVALAPFDFAGVAAEVGQHLKPLVEQKGLKLEIHVPHKLPMVGDRRKCYQVLLNLTNNAVKFTERGVVRIEAAPQGGRLAASVVDTGIGIRPEQLRLLFEAFRQLDGTPRRLYEGTGLGLHLSRKLLDLMAGDIHVESEFRAGSRFSFTVPLDLSAQPREART